MTRRTYFSDVLIRRRKRRLVLVTAAPPAVTYIPPRRKHRLLPDIPPIIHRKRRLAPVIPASIKYVQGNFNFDTTTVSTVAVTLASTVGNGNGIVGYVSWAGSGTITGITDDKTNSYIVINTFNDASFGFTLATFYLLNITNAPQTITVNFSAANHFGHVIGADEFSGVGALDGHAINFQSPSGSGTDVVTSGAITTTANGDVIWGATNDTSAGFQITGTGFTTASSTASGLAFPYTVTEYRKQSTAGSIAATFTTNPSQSDHTITGVVALQLPLPSSPTTYIPPRRKHRISPGIAIIRRKRRLAPISTGSTPTTYPLDQKSWIWSRGAPVLTFSIASTGKAFVWNHQAPALTFNVPAAQKDWVWNHQAPLLNFNIAAAQKSWTWNHQAPTLTFTSVATSKSWVWNHQAPVLQFNIAAAQKHWLWNAQAPVDVFAIAAAQKHWVWNGQAPSISNGFTGIIWNWRANAPTLTAAIAASPQHWVWVHNAPTLTFNIVAAQKTWVWNKQAPTLQFAIALAQKAWVWSKNTYLVNSVLLLGQKAVNWSARAPAVTLTLTQAQKALHWLGNAPGVASAFTLASRAWRWIGQSPTVTGGNLNPKTNLHMPGGLNRKRRSHPPE